MLDKNTVELWLDGNPEFTFDYFTRKATRHMINTWLADRVATIVTDQQHERSTPVENVVKPRCGSSPTRSGYRTPNYKISPDELNPQHLQPKPIVHMDDVTGLPSFYNYPRSTSPVSGRRTGVQNIRMESREIRTRRISQYRIPNPQLQYQAQDGRQFIDERDMIMKLVMDITMELDLTTVSHRILQNVSILLDAHRCSLFLMKEKDGETFLVSRLFDVSKESSLEENVVANRNEIKIKLGQGIAGLVAKTGNVLNIPDAYKDSRFDQSIDVKTGYRTHNILCMPIHDPEMKIVGVAQVINKKNGNAIFTEKDEKIFASYLAFCGIAIKNAQLFEKINLENRRNEVLLDLARVLFEEQSSLSVVMNTILCHTTSLLACERSSVQLINANQPNTTMKETFEHVANNAARQPNINQRSSTPTLAAAKHPLRKVPVNASITSYVERTGQIVNIVNTKTDKRFKMAEDEELGFVTRSLLCIPIKDREGTVIGVMQLINKVEKDGNYFTKSDEELLEAFAIFCGLGISNTRMYEITAELAAKQQVVLEVLSYHAIASEEECKELALVDPPAAVEYNLFHFDFDDSKLTDSDTLRASIRMFADLNLFNKFQIDIKVFCRWVASVKRNYRPVRYHNWRHAFNVCQSAFCILTQGGLRSRFSDHEQLALLVSCLCHDLDHRGTNNAFQAKIEHPLAQLYSTSTMEYHHYNQCLMILQSEGCEIFSQLSSVEYSHVIKLIKHAIISTDLAVYFKRKKDFFDLANQEHINWEDEPTRDLIRGMVMTSTDVAAITKPWLIQRKIAQEVAEEFFEQGDFEKSRLHQTPVDMMNREMRHKLPNMQVGFIDSICLPLYQSLAKVSSGVKPMLQGCLDNRAKWEEEGNRNTVGTIF